ncbi:MAG: hypothetical protein JST66_12020 [Bacteroidetes bacterium]|nr:hypothetical protein [Bacteroidota bacterium]
MRLFPLLFLWLNAPSVLVAQLDTLPHAWSMLLNPIALADPLGTSLQLGVEKRMSPRLTGAAEAIVYFNYRDHLREAPDELFTGHAFRLKAIRWTDRPTNDHNGFGADVTYKHIRGTCRDSIKPDGAAPSSKDYRLERSVFVVRAYWVGRDDWGRHCWGELFGGFGVRFKFSRSRGITDAERDAIDNRDGMGDSSDIPPLRHEVGDTWYPEIVIGARVGFGWDRRR